MSLSPLKPVPNQSHCSTRIFWMDGKGGTQSPPVSKDTVQGAGSSLVLLLPEKHVEAKYDQ